MVSESIDGCELIFTHQLGKDTRSYKSNYDKILEVLPGYQLKWDTKGCIENLVTAFNEHKLTDEMLQTKLHRLKVLSARMKDGTLDVNLRFVK